MSILPFCPHPAQDIRITWVTSRGTEDTGPICKSCAASLWAQLQRFPDAMSSFTIHPVGAAA